MDSINAGTIEAIRKLGISEAAVFPAGDIKFNDVFRDMCKQNLCGRYGKNYTCPPHNGELDDLKNEVIGYDYAILIQTICAIEDSFDFEGMQEGEKLHEKNILTAREYIQSNIKFSKILTLGAGGCKLCSPCRIVDNLPCAFPEKAVSSVEGYAMDVADMTNTHGLKYINGANTVSYVAIFLMKN